MRNFAIPAVMTLFLSLSSGCAPAVSPELARQAAPGLTFAALAAHPETYRGKMVLLGGEVMDVQPAEGGSLLRVNQKELDAAWRPVEAPVSGGTFLVHSAGRLSPDDYTPRRKVTVAGVAAGKRHGLPLIQARQIHLWERPEQLDDFLREWFGKDMEYWYTRPYFDPWRTGPGI
ncbi:MAG: hypothetical protein FJ128_12660 [Deltaproteobacteria bacterium]|nr:hypothetical protein [Deltaproteobacteria bacterium]